MADTVVTTAGAAAATAAGLAGAQITVVGFQIGADLISSPPSASATGVSTLSYPTATGVDPTTLIPGTAANISYQVINGNTMLFKITLDQTVGGTAGFDIGNIGLYISNGLGGYTLFSLTALPSVDYKYATNSPVTGNVKVYNIAIQLTGIASVINVTYINTDTLVLPTVANRVALPSVGSATSPVYVVLSDPIYNNSPSIALRGSSAFTFIPTDTGWGNSGDKSTYAVDTGTVNALAVSVLPTFSALTAGRKFFVKAANNNTGASTLNVNGLGAVSVVNNDGSSLIAGQLSSNGIHQVVYDGSKFILISQSYIPINRSGDTIPGNMYFTGGVVVKNILKVDSAQTPSVSNVETDLTFTRNGINRWYLFASSTLETGTDGVGTDFGIARCNNAGTYIDSPLTILRSSGIATFSQIPLFPTASSGDSSYNGATTAFVQNAVQSGASLYAADTSVTANTLTATLSPAPASLYNGLLFRVRVANTNTGACTLNLNGFGAKSIVNPDGNAVTAGQLTALGVIEVLYDGTKFQLLSSSYSSFNKLGDTVSGNITTNSHLIVSGPAGGDRPLILQTSGNNRWMITANSTPETGSNTGSDFAIQRYSDAGAYIDAPITFTRSNGNMSILYSLTVGGGLVANAMSTNSTLTVNGASSTSRVIYFDTSGSTRWAFYTSATPESGANAGSDFIIQRYSDTGAYIDQPLTIGRSSGNVSLSQQLFVARELYVNSTGNFVSGVTINGSQTPYVSNVETDFRFTRNGACRWYFYTDSSLETGTDGVGTDFGIGRCNNAGAYLSSPITISRATGVVTMVRGGSGNTQRANFAPGSLPMATNIPYNFNFVPVVPGRLFVTASEIQGGSGTSSYPTVIYIFVNGTLYRQESSLGSYTVVFDLDVSGSLLGTNVAITVIYYVDTSIDFTGSIFTGHTVNSQTQNCGYAFIPY